MNHDYIGSNPAENIFSVIMPVLFANVEKSMSTHFTRSKRAFDKCRMLLIFLMCYDTRNHFLLVRSK